MTDFLKKKFEGFSDLRKRKIPAAAVTAAAAAIALCCILGFWQARQPKFQDVTLELGENSLEIGQFLRAGVRAGKASFTDSAAGVDLNALGDHEMVLRYGGKLERVTLHIVDTVAPRVEFLDSRRELTSYVPDPQDFVRKVEDFSDTTVSFDGEPVLPEDNSDVTLTVVVTDAAGNETRRDCTLQLQWLKDSYTMELGERLTREDLLGRPQLDGDRIPQEQIDRINMAGAGVYTVTEKDGEASCQVTVRDTKGPELMVQPVKRKAGSLISPENFVLAAEDYSGMAELRLITPPDMETEGFQNIIVEAEDIYGNVTRKETTLHITDDLQGPIITSQWDLKVPVYSEPDYLVGVSARDVRDGYVELFVDDSHVRLSTPGSYSVYYTATDAAGNTTVLARPVEVVGDPQNPEELVKKLAAELSDDPVEIRDYIRKNIAYSQEWGEGDPVVYGLTRLRGNCFIHAICLKAIYEEKGYESNLIWTTDKTHYWVQVKVGDDWRHIDATPGAAHSLYALMTDEQRLETLDRRTWDTSAWPECK